MGAGYDTEEWDVNGNCRGMKWICGNATNPAGFDSTLIGRVELARGTGINPDFDVNVLNGDCFGARKTIENGARASVNEKYVKVWCSGILDNPIDTIATGEIAAVQPTCAALAEDGFVGVLNNKCYGKRYDTAQYFIECADASAELPSRIIILNGADVYAAGNEPSTAAAAAAKFDTMYSVSQSQRTKYNITSK